MFVGVHKLKEDVCWGNYLLLLSSLAVSWVNSCIICLCIAYRLQYFTYSCLGEETFGISYLYYFFCFEWPLLPSLPVPSSQSIWPDRSKLSFKLKWPIFLSHFTNTPLITVSNNIGEKIFMTVRRWTTDRLPASLYSFLHLHLTFWKPLFYCTPHLSGTQFLRKQICSSH